MDEHVVLCAPPWRGSTPARPKGLFERAVLPGRTFDNRYRTRGVARALLTGRTGRIVIPPGTPNEALTAFFKDAMHIKLRQYVFDSMRISPPGSAGSAVSRIPLPRWWRSW